MVVLTVMGALAGSAWAQDAAGLVTKVPLADRIILSNVDRAFVLICAFMVFIMQGGFCLLELGMARAKNCINVVMKNLLDFAVAALVFLIGFVFMFGPTQGGWVGFGGFEYLVDPATNPDLWVFLVFQMMFVGTASTIASGAMAERTGFVGYLCFTVVLSLVIYPVIGHWAWGSGAGSFGFGGSAGWLEEKGFLDFAGSTVVHGVGGACALAGVLVVGPRRGRFAADGTPRLIVGHNLPFAALGTFLLWFGWFGFNAGSNLTSGVSATGPELGGIVLNTVIAPAVGAITAMISLWIVDGRPDVNIALNGALAGLVSITAGCNVGPPLAALAIGMIGGLVTTFGGILLEKMRIDDVVSAVPVHLFAGIWGTLAVGLFHRNGFDSSLLTTQATGCLSMCLAAFIAAFIVFKLIDLTIGLRASDDDQEDGLDFAEHSATGYPDFVTIDQD